MGVEPQGSVAGAAGGGAGAAAGFELLKVKPPVIDGAACERVLSPSSALSLSSPTTGPPLSASSDVGAAPGSLSPGRVGVVLQGKAVEDATGGTAIEDGLVDSGGGLAADPNENKEEAAGVDEAGAGGVPPSLPNEKSDGVVTGLGAGAAAAEPKVKGEDADLLAPLGLEIAGDATGAEPNENGVAAAGFGAPGTGIELKGLDGAAPNGLDDGLPTALASPDEAAAGLLDGVEPKVKPLLAMPPKGFAGGAPKEAAPKLAIDGGGVFGEGDRSGRIRCGLRQGHSLGKQSWESGRTELATFALGDARPVLAILRCGRPRILQT